MDQDVAKGDDLPQTGTFCAIAASMRASCTSASPLISLDGLPQDDVTVEVGKALAACRTYVERVHNVVGLMGGDTRGG
jgi:hypothetical protein